MSNKKKILAQLSKGEIKLYEIEKFTDLDQAIIIRREYLKTLTKSALDSVKIFSFSPEQIYHRNCENVIGGVSLPVGIAGPILVNGEYAKGKFFVPFATTEGALVASINRGMKVINESGGASTSVIYHGITRAPVFKTSSLKDSKVFVKFIQDNLANLKKITMSTGRFIKLIKFTPFINGKSVWLRFHFDTKDAMGMNMAVKATQAITDYVTKKTNVKLVAISGNMCIDKKPAMINTLLGRGRSVQAEVKVQREVAEKYLNTTIEDMFDVNFRKIWQGSNFSGSLGYNAHIANIVVANFIATGQDPAHVVDASVSTTTMEIEGNQLYVFVNIPSLNVATVGGGTSLASQAELINLMLANVDSSKQIKNRTDAFAEILGAAILAGEINLHAAFSNNTFVKAHEDLGRSKYRKSEY